MLARGTADVRVAPKIFVAERDDEPCISRYRPKGALGNGVGNVRNASEMRQKCAKMGLVSLRKEECARNASKMRLKSVKNARNTFGGEPLLEDTEFRDAATGLDVHDDEICFSVQDAVWLGVSLRIYYHPFPNHWRRNYHLQARG